MKKYRGGVFPSNYFDTNAKLPMANAGTNLYNSYNTIRPPLHVVNYRGGTRRTRTRRHRNGGFVPSVMSGFTGAASKYIVPIALYSGYKFITRKTEKTKKTKKRKKNKR